MTEITATIGKTGSPRLGCKAIALTFPKPKWPAKGDSEIIPRFASCTNRTARRSVCRPFCRPSTQDPLGFSAAKSQRFGLSHQIGQRLCAHLPHDVSAMNLHGDFGKPEFGCNLLVHKARRYQRHDLPLAGT